MSKHVRPAPISRSCTAAFLPLMLVVAALMACGGPEAGSEAHEHDEAALGAVHFDVSCSDVNMLP